MTTAEIFIWTGVGFLIMALVILLLPKVLNIYEKKKRNYLAFNEAHPVGDLFITKLGNQKFPYGKWELRGFDQNGSYVFERMK